MVTRTTSVRCDWLLQKCYTPFDEQIMVAQCLFCCIVLPTCFHNITTCIPAWNQNHINSICSTWGKDHFKTFDGDVYQYPGLCEYNLASDCHESFLEFSVHMKKALVDGHPSISRVVVTIKDLVIILSKNLATVNGEK